MNVIEQAAPQPNAEVVEDYFRSRGYRWCTAAGQASMVSARAAQGWYPVLASEVADPEVLRALKKFNGARVTRDDTIDVGGAILYECTEEAWVAAYMRTALLDHTQDDAPTRSLEDLDHSVRGESGGKVRFDLDATRAMGGVSSHVIGGQKNADALHNLARTDLGLKE
ncbi:MAG TPA: hypothetical protein DEH78_18990 [Solibacterales bacterium]|nr:hypothetical protein [Bryobacterales bacterium]